MHIIPLASDLSFPCTHSGPNVGSHLNTAASVGVSLQQKERAGWLGEQDGKKKKKEFRQLATEPGWERSPEAPPRQFPPGGNLCHPFLTLHLPLVLHWDQAPIGEEEL